MKKLTFMVALFLCIAFCFTISAYGEGKLTVTDKVFVIPEGDDSGYFGAKVENTGDEAIAVDTGSLVIMSQNAEILSTSNYVYCVPGDIILEPGEYVYAYEFVWDSNLEDKDIGECMISFGTDDRGTKYDIVKCDAAYDFIGEDSYENYMYVTINNTTDRQVYDMRIVIALYDTEGNLMFVKNDIASSFAIHPGSSITVRAYIDNDAMKYFEENDLKPGSIEAFAYFEVEE